MCFEYLEPEQTCDHHVELLYYSKTKAIMKTFSKKKVILNKNHEKKYRRKNIRELTIKFTNSSR